MCKTYNINVVTFFYGIAKFLKSNFMRFRYSLLDFLEFFIQGLTIIFVLSACAYKNNTSFWTPTPSCRGSFIPDRTLPSKLKRSYGFFVQQSCKRPPSLSCHLVCWWKIQSNAAPDFFTDITLSTKAGFGFMQLIWRSPSKALGYIADGSLDCLREIIKG